MGVKKHSNCRNLNGTLLLRNHLILAGVRIKRGYGRTDEWRTDGYHKFLWNVFFKPYPRFILLDKTRIWLEKHVSQKFMISVRPPLIRPSVRYSSVRPYPRFILTHLGCIHGNCHILAIRSRLISIWKASVFFLLTRYIGHICQWFPVMF